MQSGVNSYFLCGYSIFLEWEILGSHAAFNGTMRIIWNQPNFKSSYKRADFEINENEIWFLYGWGFGDDGNK